MKQIIKGLGIAILLITIFSTPVFAAIIKMADSFGVDDANGNPNTYVLVPVTITNVINGPIQTIKFDVVYDTNIMTLKKITPGDLTLGWANINLGLNKKSVTLNTSSDLSKAISDGSSGVIVLLNFSIKNKPGNLSWINITKIDFANVALQGGNASARNGTFTVNLGPTIDTPKGNVHLSPDGKFEKLEYVDPNTLPEVPQPGNFEYGLFRFNITGINPVVSSTTVILTFPNDLPNGTTYWKYGPTSTNNSPHWYTIPSMIDTINRKQLTITLVDGGLGDDEFLTANGRIVDDGGPLSPQGPPPPVPELPTVVLMTVGVIGLISIMRRMNK